jgi:hypothetical protein
VIRRALIRREQVHRRLAAPDTFGYRIGVHFVSVASRTDPALELHAAALLHHVRRFVRRGMHVRLLTERNVISSRVGACTDRCGCIARRSTEVRLNAGHIVVGPKRTLDAVEVR